MAVQVKLPTILRKHAGGEPKVSAEGATLRDVLGDLESRYPGITKNVLSEDGGLHRFVNVYLNDEDVRYLGSLETEVGEGDTVSILPAVAGGSLAPTDREPGDQELCCVAETLDVSVGPRDEHRTLESADQRPGDG